MSKRFYSLEADVYVLGRWYLSEPVNFSGLEVEDIWQFIDGKLLEVTAPLRIPVDRPGNPLDLDFAGAGQTPIVSARVAAVFRELAPEAVQLFPVEVEGHAEPYFLLNVSRLIDAVDESACRSVQRWTVEDGSPDRVGEFHLIEGLRIDSAKVWGARVFRLWGYSLPIIVDEQVKSALVEVGCSGGRFTEV